jgi:hypothetical protein
MKTEWHGVQIPPLPSWSALATESSTLSWTRVRDVMPGYRYGVKDVLALRPVASPQKTRLVERESASLKWFEERFVGEEQWPRLPLARRDDTLSTALPPALYAVEIRDGREVVTYGEQCLSTSLCFTWQRWPASPSDPHASQ